MHLQQCCVSILATIRFIIRDLTSHLFFVSFPPPPQVKVTVLDKNDSPPEFRDTPLRYSVSEDLGAGHTIATLHATDPDTIGTLTYTLTGSGGSSSSSGPSPFQLDGSSGVLTLRDTLDRELKDEYELVVRASDGIQYTETTVTVQVSPTQRIC